MRRGRRLVVVGGGPVLFGWASGVVVDPQSQSCEQSGIAEISDDARAVCDPHRPIDRSTDSIITNRSNAIDLPISSCGAQPASQQTCPPRAGQAKRATHAPAVCACGPLPRIARTPFSKSRESVLRCPRAPCWRRLPRHTHCRSHNQFIRPHTPIQPQKGKGRQEGGDGGGGRRRHGRGGGSRRILLPAAATAAARLPPQPREHPVRFRSPPPSLPQQYDHPPPLKPTNQHTYQSTTTKKKQAGAAHGRGGLERAGAETGGQVGGGAARRAAVCGKKGKRRRRIELLA